MDLLPMAAAPAADPPPRGGTIAIEIQQLERSYARLRVTATAAQQARLAASLSLHGQRHPVLVVREDGGRTVLVDGHRRVDALERLGRDTVVAMVLALEESEALAYCHRMQTSGRRSALEEGWLVAEMLEHGRSLAEIGEALDRSTSWTSRRLALARALPEPASAVVRRGVVPPHGAMKSLVPLARANKEHCEKLCQGLGARPVSTRQLATLYAAWRAGDQEQRERIVGSPGLFLDAERAVRGKKPEGVVGALVRDLESARSALVRAGDGALRAWDVEPGALSSALVARALTRCTDAHDALLKQVEEPHAG